MITLNKTKEGTIFTLEGTAQLFNIPVSASLLVGPAGRLELKIFTSKGRKIALSSIISSAARIPVCDSSVSPLNLNYLLFTFLHRFCSASKEIDKRELTKSFFSLLCEIDPQIPILSRFYSWIRERIIKS